MPLNWNMRFRIRSIFLIMAIFALIFAVGSWIGKKWSSATFITQKIQSLNGAVGVGFPVNEIHFSVAGLRPLVRDGDMQEMAPYLANMKLQVVGLVNTKISDRGFQHLLDGCRDTIRDLDISGSSLNDKSLQSLTTCPNLKTIALPKKLLTDSGIRALEKLKSLREIFVYEADQGDMAVKTLERKMGNRATVHAYPAKSTF